MTVRRGVLAPSVGKNEWHSVGPGVLLARCASRRTWTRTLLCFILFHFISLLLNSSPSPQSWEVDVGSHFPKDKAEAGRPHGPPPVMCLESGRPRSQV